MQEDTDIYSVYHPGCALQWNIKPVTKYSDD